MSVSLGEHKGLLSGRVDGNRLEESAKEAKKSVLDTLVQGIKDLFSDDGYTFIKKPKAARQIKAHVVYVRATNDPVMIDQIDNKRVVLHPHIEHPAQVGQYQSGAEEATLFVWSKGYNQHNKQ